MAYCPVCLEDVENTTPEDWQVPGVPMPAWRHRNDRTHLCIRNGDDGHEPCPPTFTRLELIAQRTDLIGNATRQRLALIAEEIGNGGDWAVVFQAAGVADDGMLEDELVEEVRDLLDQREE